MSINPDKVICDYQQLKNIANAVRENTGTSNLMTTSEMVEALSTSVIPISKGGTGATTAAAALTNLGIIDGNVCNHNGFYRGKCVQDKLVDGSLYTAISDGSFDDLYIGDYFSVSISTTEDPSEQVICCIAGFDTMYNNGDIALTKHHAVIVPKNCFLGYRQMNSENTTSGGYKGSAMYTSVLPTYAALLEEVFGTHLLTFRSLITNSVNTSANSAAGAGWTGSANGWEWVDMKLQLLSEIQVYGANVFSSSGYDTGIDNIQLPIFALNPNFKIANRVWYWLKNIAGASHFCGVSGYGDADPYYASRTGGVRPLFLLG